MNQLNETQVSALLDAELGHHETLALVDRLVESESLRSFYRAARRLDHLVDEAGAAAAAGDLPAGLWERIERAAGTPPERSAGRRPQWPWRWAMQAAAVCVIAIAAWWLTADAGRQPVAFQQPGDVMSVSLASRPGTMTDTRFLELTTELLRADRHYHEQMFEILRAIRPTGREGGSEGLLPLTDAQPQLRPAGDDDGARRVWD